MGYQASSGNEAYLGYKLSSVDEGNLGLSENHGAMSYQSALGQGFSGGNYVFKMPSGFVLPASNGGSSGHFSGMSYLPPSSHSGYYSHQ